MNEINHEFAPIYNSNTKILILGSFPSIKSRERKFYYMNEYNRFYKVLSFLLKEDIENTSIDDKIKILLDNKIGVFDVIKSCTIVGSADATISNVTVNDIYGIIEKTNVKRIFLNGGLAYSLFLKYFPDLKEIAINLPSTSPANARYRLGDLIEKWKVILEYL